MLSHTIPTIKKILKATLLATMPMIPWAFELPFTDLIPKISPPRASGNATNRAKGINKKAKLVRPRISDSLACLFCRAVIPGFFCFLIFFRSLNLSNMESFLLITCGPSTNIPGNCTGLSAAYTGKDSSINKRSSSPGFTVCGLLQM